MRDLERLKCGGFLTEMYTVGSGLDDMYKMFDLADQYKQSWHGWDYTRPAHVLPSPSPPSRDIHQSPKKAVKSPLLLKQQILKTKESDDDHLIVSKGGSSNIQIMDTSRTYPQAVAGFTDTYKFDKDSNVFTLSYRTNAACKSGVTEIYFNRVMHYPDGFDHELSPSEGVSMSISDDGFRVLLKHDVKMAAGTLITFSMKPKTGKISLHFIP